MIIILGFLACTLSALHAAEGSVRLHNGALLSGEVGVENSDALRIHSYWAEPSILVPVERVKDFIPEEKDPLPQAGVEITAVGGSRLWLKDLLVSPTGISGQSSWGEQVSLSFADVEQVYLSSATQAVLRIPTSEDPPLEDARIRFLHGGGLMARAPAQHLFEVDAWPERFLLDLTLEESSSETGIQVLCAGPDSGRDGRFLLRIHPHRVTVTLIEPDGEGRLSSFNLPYPLQPGQSILRIRVLGNRLTGRMKLQIGEGDVLEWEMKTENLLQSALDRPATLVLQDIRSDRKPEIRRLALVRWESDAFPPLQMKEPGLLLNTGEVIAGTVQSLLPDQVVLTPETEGGEERAVDRAEVLVWNPAAAPVETSSPVPPLARILSRLPGEEFRFRRLRFVTRESSLRVQGELEQGSTVEIPSAGIRSLTLAPANSFPESVADESAAPCYVGLLNDDRLMGNFGGLSGSNINFFPAWAPAEPLRIRGAAVRTLRFSDAGSLSRPSFVLWMKNGCRITGDLKSLSETELTMQTRWAEELVVDRDQIQRLERIQTHPSARSLLTDDLEGWSFYEGTFVRLKDQPQTLERTPSGWRLMQQGVYLRVTDPLPADRADFQLRLGALEHLSGGGVALEINGFADQDGRGRQLRLRFSSQQVRAEIYGEGQLLGQWAEFLSTAAGSSLDFRISMRGPSNRFLIEIGEQIKWELPLDALAFSTKSMPYEIRITLSSGVEGIALEQLQAGEGAEDPLPRMNREAMAPGNIVFRNGDRMQAEVNQIQDGEVQLISPGGNPLTLPLDRLYHLAIGDEDPQALRRRASHARFVLNGGDDVFLAEVLGATPDAFQVRREGITGVFHLPVDQMNEVKLNPYF